MLKSPLIAEHHRPLPAAVDAGEAAHALARLGVAVQRWGVVAILLFFGAFKFTAVEAEAIRPLIEHSPFMSWLYAIASTRAVSNLVGSVELVIAIAIALRSWSPRASAIGSIAGAATFGLTLSFLFTTPGLWVSVPGFPLPVPNETGAFLLKDLFLLGACLGIASEAARAFATSSAPPGRSPA